MRSALAMLTLAVVSHFASPGHTATITVTTTADTGAGSLRRAISRSNKNGVADKITFAASLAGQTIQPLSPLAILTDGNLTIDGNVDSDVRPDIIIDGSQAGGAGLEVQSANNVIRGLVIRKFAKAVAIKGPQATNNVVCKCYLGTNPTGTRARPNKYGVYISGGAASNTIGGRSTGRRNLISGNTATGVVVRGGSDNSVLGNYIGLDRKGTAAVGNGVGVVVAGGAVRTNIGSGLSRSGNVISGSQNEALYIAGGGTRNTNVFRNTIGTTADQNDPLVNGPVAVRVTNRAGRVVFGRSGRGNDICCWGHQTAILLESTKAGRSIIEGNSLTMPATASVYQPFYGIRINAPSGASYTCRIADNLFFAYETGIDLTGSAVCPVITNNNFQWSRDGVCINAGARPDVGNLQDANTGNDGGNNFTGLLMGIINYSDQDIPAEGNNWGTTSSSAIDAMIHDQNDDPGCGLVDYDPVIGGVHPSGAAADGTVQLTGLAAQPTPAGAEVAFTLSAAAEVTVEVVNIAGRRVAEIRPQNLSAGLNRLSWSGTTLAGTRAPAGTYLVRLIARTPSGGQTSGLTSLRLAR